MRHVAELVKAGAKTCAEMTEIQQRTFWQRLRGGVR